MKYKSILVLHTLQDSIESLETAVILANKWNAQIDICVLSLPESTRQVATLQGADVMNGVGARADIINTDNRLEKIRRFTDEHKIAVRLTNHFTIEENVEELLTKSSLYSDLVVISHASSLLAGVHRKCLDTILLDSNKSVLLTATESTRERNELRLSKGFEHIAIAWHEDIHSIHAIRAAFPLLELAKKIDLVLIENGNMNSSAELNAASNVTDIEAYLARHGLSVSLSIAKTDGRFVSHALLDTINRLNPDLLVMGAFGHSRLAEKLLHGVTYDVLESLLHTDLFLSHAN